MLFMHTAPIQVCKFRNLYLVCWAPRLLDKTTYVPQFAAYSFNESIMYRWLFRIDLGLGGILGGSYRKP